MVSDPDDDALDTHEDVEGLEAKQEVGDVQMTESNDKADPAEYDSDDIDDGVSLKDFIATYDLRYLSTSLRHYACADCCRKIVDDKTGQYLSGTGWHVFEVQGLPDAFNPTVKPMPPSTTTTSSFLGPPGPSGANKLDVDVLCWGGTHRFDAFEYMDKFFVNLGSATGAYTTGWTKEGEEMAPSFYLMDVLPCLTLSR
ncbi:Metallo-dependent phosphatase [Apiospora sp. TS-2023a]